MELGVHEPHYYLQLIFLTFCQEKNISLIACFALQATIYTVAPTAVNNFCVRELIFGVKLSSRRRFSSSDLIPPLKLMKMNHAVQICIHTMRSFLLIKCKKKYSAMATLKKLLLFMFNGVQGVMQMTLLQVKKKYVECGALKSAFSKIITDLIKR